ncbi:hypothetical protein TGGT1_408980 [Toxoplasma gondii GT1]|uniref:Uncharacterized protein n=1 Tax=Toxoplasma gondii (strain ATCC 50853 / GT1) TaxID=507601 RepID=S7WEK9_TOXGG|nr:hypothetical protein TGGT1_408980 [Toxoplasma gondii GT1]
MTARNGGGKRQEKESTPGSARNKGVRLSRQIQAPAGDAAFFQRTFKEFQRRLFRWTTSQTDCVGAEKEFPNAPEGGGGQQLSGHPSLEASLEFCGEAERRPGQFQRRSRFHPVRKKWLAAEREGQILHVKNAFEKPTRLEAGGDAWKGQDEEEQEESEGEQEAEEKAAEEDDDERGEEVGGDRQREDENN